MMYVFHLTANDPNCSVECREPANALRYFQNLDPRFSYRLVAEVDTKDIEYAYQITNNIESNWVENRGIHLVHGLTRRPDRPCASHRSTSVGDIILDTNVGRLMFCAPFGWEMLIDNAPTPAANSQR